MGVRVQGEFLRRTLPPFFASPAPSSFTECEGAVKAEWEETASREEGGAGSAAEAASDACCGALQRGCGCRVCGSPMRGAR